MREGKDLFLPLEREVLKNLKAGQIFFLNGEIYTVRDQAHRKLISAFKEGKKIPFSLKNQTIYYTGPTPPPPGKIVGAIGPTTSTRLDYATPFLLKKGLQGMIGKGKRSREIEKLIKKYQAIYWLAIGGAGVLYARCVREIELVAYEYLGPEAIYKLKVEHFPVLVGIDRQGRSILGNI
jgi:fumarate hydratase subunit beta